MEATACPIALRSHVRAAHALRQESPFDLPPSAACELEQFLGQVRRECSTRSGVGLGAFLLTLLTQPALAGLPLEVQPPTSHASAQALTMPADPLTLSLPRQALQACLTLAPYLQQPCPLVLQRLTRLVALPVIRKAWKDHHRFEISNTPHAELWRLQPVLVLVDGLASCASRLRSAQRKPETLHANLTGIAKGLLLCVGDEECNGPGAGLVLGNVSAELQTGHLPNLRLCPHHFQRFLALRLAAHAAQGDVAKALLAACEWLAQAGGLLGEQSVPGGGDSHARHRQALTGPFGMPVHGPLWPSPKPFPCPLTMHHPVLPRTDVPAEVSRLLLRRFLHPCVVTEAHSSSLTPLADPSTHMEALASITRLKGWDWGEAMGFPERAAPEPHDDDCDEPRHPPKADASFLGLWVDPHLGALGEVMWPLLQAAPPPPVHKYSSLPALAAASPKALPRIVQATIPERLAAALQLLFTEQGPRGASSVYCFVARCLAEVGGFTKAHSGGVAWAAKLDQLLRGDFEGAGPFPANVVEQTMQKLHALQRGLQHLLKTHPDLLVRGAAATLPGPQAPPPDCPKDAPGARSAKCSVFDAQTFGLHGIVMQLALVPSRLHLPEGRDPIDIPPAVHSVKWTTLHPSYHAAQAVLGLTSPGDEPSSGPVCSSSISTPVAHELQRLVPQAQLGWGGGGLPSLGHTPEWRAAWLAATRKAAVATEHSVHEGLLPVAYTGLQWLESCGLQCPTPLRTALATEDERTSVVAGVEPGDKRAWSRHLAWLVRRRAVLLCAAAQG